MSERAILNERYRVIASLHTDPG